MTELLENSDNTNESAVVSESPANEATISLAAVQALADALQKIESYTPTVWVDNESPDIDAAHLNKAEQAITRVTTAMNSAVDVIKDLQSQVNTTNNNLSNKFAAKDISNGSLNQITTTGFYSGSNITEVTPYIKSHKWCLINAYVSGNSASIFVIAGDAIALSIYRNGVGIYSYYPIATKSDLSNRASYNSGVTDLDSAPDAIILRTNTDPTGYPTNLGGNSCLAFQLNPGTKYSAQLAFSFSKDRLAIRRKNNSDTWTAWKYVDFTIS